MVSEGQGSEIVLPQVAELVSVRARMTGVIWLLIRRSFLRHHSAIGDWRHSDDTVLGYHVVHVIICIYSTLQLEYV